MLGKHTGVLRKKGCAALFKALICAAAIVTITAAASSDIYGYTAVRGTVTCKSGKVRKDAKQNAPFVFGVTKDEIVTVIGEKKGDDGVLWYQIKVLDSTGYIRADLVKKSKVEVKSESTIEIKEEKTQDKTQQKTEDKPVQSKNEQPQTAVSGAPVVKGTNVIVREGASTKSGIRLMVQKGQVLTLISNQTGDDGKTWCYVSFNVGNNSYKGFIRSDLVVMPQDASQEVQEEVKPENSDEDKTNVSEENAGDTPKEVNGEIPVTQVGKIRGTGVNIRKEPVSGKVIGILNTGNQITVIDQVRGEADQNIWCKINFIYNKTPQTGYVRSDFTDGIKLHVTGEKIEEEPKPEEHQAENVETAENKENKPSSQPAGGSTSTASIKGTGVRIREAAVTGNVISQLDTGYPVTVLDETEGSDGYKWYKIEFSKNDRVRTGYVRSDLVTISVSQYSEALADEDFENQIAEFPNDYKASLRALHEKYPSWRFVPVNTGLDWNNVVAAETTVGKNLVAKTSIASWKSTAPQAYNWATNSWYGFDGGSWAAASPELIKYYLDPRNFLDDSGIFQFETLGFEDYQNEDGVNNIVSTTFMRNGFTDTDGAERTYASVFYEAGQTFGISPYHLASRCIQEQGYLGASQSINGHVGGLENLFNYFNIGAYAAGGRTATINGLYYAAGTDEDYFRPWNSRYRSIMGAAKYISDKYVSLGQNTLYFQKFNVVNTKNGIYSHQYMSNVVAASAESARLRKAYSDLNTVLVFRIPYYSNMPGDKCQKPTSDSNPNTYLSSLGIEGYSFTNQFSPVYNMYYVNVDESVEYVNVIASAVSESSSIGGTGTVALVMGENKIQVTCKAQNGSSKVYTIIVRRG